MTSKSAKARPSFPVAEFSVKGSALTEKKRAKIVQKVKKASKSSLSPIKSSFQAGVVVKVKETASGSGSVTYSVPIAPHKKKLS